VHAQLRALKRAASMGVWELRRNGWQRGERRPGSYSAAEAQQRAVRVAVKPRVERKLVLGTAAGAAVLEQFAAGLSPEQAAHTLKRMHA
jgi:IS30 family transposase